MYKWKRLTTTLFKALNQVLTHHLLVEWHSKFLFKTNSCCKSNSKESTVPNSLLLMDLA